MEIVTKEVIYTIKDFSYLKFDKNDAKFYNSDHYVVLKCPIENIIGVKVCKKLWI